MPGADLAQLLIRATKCFLYPVSTSRQLPRVRGPGQAARPAGIARASTAKLNQTWDEVIFQKSLLTLEAKYQKAVAGGTLSLAQAWELSRVPAGHRAELMA